MTKTDVKKRAKYAVGTAVATAAIPAGMGVFKWEVLAGAAAVGLVGGAFGVDVAGMVKKAATKKASPS